MATFYRVDKVKIEDEDIIEYCSDALNPEDVFAQEQLETWAEENGYVKEDNDD